MRKVNPMKTRYGSSLPPSSACSSAAARRRPAEIPRLPPHNTEPMSACSTSLSAVRALVSAISAKSAAGRAQTAILAHLQRRDDVYRLTTGEVLQLREAGVSDRVIDYLLLRPTNGAARAANLPGAEATATEAIPAIASAGLVIAAVKAATDENAPLHHLGPRAHHCGNGTRRRSCAEGHCSHSRRTSPRRRRRMSCRSRA